MRRLVIVLLVSTLGVGMFAPAAHAGRRTATNVALGLASFAVFNQLFGPVLYPRPVYAVPVVTAPPIVYSVSPVYTVPAPVLVVRPTLVPSYPTVVQYPHGRYELRGDGFTTAYHWVWIPNPPPAPPAGVQQPASPPASTPSAAEPCKPTGKYVKTPHGVLPECE